MIVLQVFGENYKNKSELITNHHFMIYLCSESTATHSCSHVAAASTPAASAPATSAAAANYTATAVAAHFTADRTFRKYGK